MTPVWGEAEAALFSPSNDFGDDEAMLGSQGQGMSFFGGIAEGLFTTQEIAASYGYFGEIVLFDENRLTIAESMTPGRAAGVARHTAIVGKAQQRLVVVKAIVFEDLLPFWLDV